MTATVSAEPRRRPIIASSARCLALIALMVLGTTSVLPQCRYSRIDRPLSSSPGPAVAPIAFLDVKFWRSSPPPQPQPLQRYPAAKGYLARLEDHFNVTIERSFAHLTVARALGPDGIMVDIERRYELESADGLQRIVPSRALTDLRLLGTEYIDNRYGLTNILLSLASMFAYAGIDGRAVVFPYRTPCWTERLLDLRETERMLLPAGVVLLNDTEVRSFNLTRGLRAKKLGLGLGSRAVMGSLDRNTAAQGLLFLRSQMTASRRVKFFVHSAFFLRFPFRATAPFDACFFMRRMVFHQTIRTAAANVFRSLQSVGVDRLMAVHLRLEFDAALLDPQARSISPQELSRFFAEDLVPVALRARANAIYVCSGRLRPDYMAALKAVHFPVYTKWDFSDRFGALPDDTSQTTSHTRAAVDTLVLTHSAVAVTFLGSTLTAGVASRRCPSPAAGAFADFRGVFRVNGTVKTFGVGMGGLQGPRPPSSHTGGPGMFGYWIRPHVTGATSGGSSSNVSFTSTSSRFSRLHFVSCDRPIGTQCFYHGLTSLEEQTAAVGGAPTSAGDSLTLGDD